MSGSEPHLLPGWRAQFTAMLRDQPSDVWPPLPISGHPLPTSTRLLSDLDRGTTQHTMPHGRDVSPGQIPTQAPEPGQDGCLLGHSLGAGGVPHHRHPHNRWGGTPCPLVQGAAGLRKCWVPQQSSPDQNSSMINTVCQEILSNFTPFCTMFSQNKIQKHILTYRSENAFPESLNLEGSSSRPRKE